MADQKEKGEPCPLRWGGAKRSWKQAVLNAVTSGNTEQLHELLASCSELIDAPISDFGRTAMHEAAASGQTATIDFLVAMGSRSMDTADDGTGDTPLHVAAKHGHVSAVEALVRLGSRAIDATNKRRDTAVHGRQERPCACDRGACSIDTPDNEGYTPMHAAAQKGLTRVISELVALGSKAIDAGNKDGRTPLHLAAVNGRVIIALIRLGSRSCVRAYQSASEYEARIAFPGPDTDKAQAVLMLLGDAPDKEEFMIWRYLTIKESATEDEIAGLRYRADFSRSLVLFAPPSTPPIVSPYRLPAAIPRGKEPKQNCAIS